MPTVAFDKALLELKGISFQVDHKKVLEGLDLTIFDREIHALLGANGSGKSTLGFIIMGCEGYFPSSGEVILEGGVINPLKIHERAHQGIALTWQEPARFEGISVADYLTLGRRMIDPADYLRRVGLSPDEYLNRMVDKTLSGGQRKRIELASVLDLNPKLAILDEPDSGIDMLSVQEIVDVIRAFREKGAAVLLITHREEIVRAADRASLLCAGKILFSGSPADVAEFYQSRRSGLCDGIVCSNG